MNHYYVPKKAQGYVCKTDAHLQFDNADHVGTDAIQETYNRLFNEWKSNKVLLTELALVLNHRIGFWSDMIKRGTEVQKSRELTIIYLDLYEQTEGSKKPRANHYLPRSLRANREVSNAKKSL